MRSVSSTPDDLKKILSLDLAHRPSTVWALISSGSNHSERSLRINFLDVPVRHPVCTEALNPKPRVPKTADPLEGLGCLIEGCVVDRAYT